MHFQSVHEEGYDLERGYIKVWFDDRGYGFIGRPGQQDVFLHISMISGNWIPVKGDKIAFDVTQDEQGRNRAVNPQLIVYG